MSKLARAILSIQCVLFLLGSHSLALAANDSAPGELFEQEFYENATPAELRAKLNGFSLRGVSRPWHDHYTSITPLMLAAKFSPHPETIDIMMNAGSEIEAFSQKPWQPDDNRNHCWDHELTALHFATRNPNVEILKRLLAYKPNLNATTVCANHFTALYMAASERRMPQHFVVLLRAGADPRLSPPKYPEMTLWRLIFGSLSQDIAPRDLAEMTSALIAAGIMPDEANLEAALLAEEYEPARIMLDTGLKPQNKGLLCAALGRRHSTIHRGKMLPEPSVQLISQLLQFDDVNAICPHYPEDTPLRLVCKGNLSVDLAKALVQAGADIDPTNLPEFRERVEGHFPKTSLLKELPTGLVNVLDKIGVDTNTANRSPVNRKAGVFPPSTLIEDSLRRDKDNPELVRYLLSLGLSASTQLGQQDLIVIAAWGHTKKPLSAIELIKAGADPMPLRVDSSTREFAWKAGILDKYDRPLIRGVMTEATKGRLAYERKMVLEAEDDYGMWSYMHCASPEAIAAKAKGLTIGKRTYNRDKSARSSNRRWVPDKASLSSYVRRKTPYVGGGGFGWTFLSSVTALNPHPESVERLAAMKADFYEEEGKAIRYAFENPNPEMAKAVLRHTRKEDVALALTDGMSWAHSAHPDHVAALQKAGFDLNAKSQDQRVIQDEKRPSTNVVLSALRGYNYAFARELIKAGVDMNYADKDNSRVLDLLIGDRQYELALTALDAGANCTYSPVQYHKDMLEYIVAHPPTESGMEADYRQLLQRIKDRCVR